MVPKLISKSIAVILILLVLGAMVWQVAPASAGFTPTPTPTAVPPTVVPTATPTVVPTATSTRPAAIRPTAIPPTAILPTATPISSTTTPTATLPLLLPVTGGSASGPNNIEINAIPLAGVLILLLAAISLVIRKSARTKNG